MSRNKSRAHSTDLTVLDPRPADMPTGVEQAIAKQETLSTEAKITVTTVLQSTKPESIKAFSERQIRAGKSYQDVLDLVLANYSKASTTIACIRWYAAQMRKAGEMVAPRPKTGRPREKFLLTTEEMNLIAAKFDGEDSANINSLLDKLRELAPPSAAETDEAVTEAA